MRLNVDLPPCIYRQRAEAYAIPLNGGRETPIEAYNCHWADEVLEALTFLQRAPPWLQNEALSARGFDEKHCLMCRVRREPAPSEEQKG